MEKDNTKTPTEEKQKAKANQTWERYCLKSLQKRSLYTGINFREYQTLKRKETEIANNCLRPARTSKDFAQIMQEFIEIMDNTSGGTSLHPKIQTITLDEVCADIRRNGQPETQLLPPAFLANTLESSRQAYLFGYDTQVTYFAIGTYTHNPNWELGLISTHTPGGPGDGFYGNGTRKLQLVEKRPDSEPFYPDVWVKNTRSYAYEGYNDKLAYQHEPLFPGSETLLHIAIEQARASKK